MAVLLNDDINGNTNLSIDDTLYLVRDFIEILDNNDDGIDVFASGTELVVRGTVGSDTENGIHINDLGGIFLPRQTTPSLSVPRASSSAI